MPRVRGGDSSKRYEWNSPQEWLAERLSNLDNDELLQDALTLCQLLDGDRIQDEYQKEMDSDGYFDEIYDECEVCGAPYADGDADEDRCSACR